MNPWWQKYFSVKLTNYISLVTLAKVLVWYNKCNTISWLTDTVHLTILFIATLTKQIFTITFLCCFNEGMIRDATYLFLTSTQGLLDKINTLFWVVITIRIIRLLFDITVFMCNHNCFITVTKLSLWAITTSLLFWCNCWPLNCMQSQSLHHCDQAVVMSNHNQFVTPT